MDNDGIYDVLKQLEIKLDMGIRLFGNYVITMPREIISAVDMLEKAIPDEILKTERELLRNGNGYIFKGIDELRNIIERSFKIIPDRVIILDKNKMLSVIDNIYANLPVDVHEARALLKS